MLLVTRKYLQRWRLKAWLHRLQASQNARRLAATWRCWVDAQGVQQLSQALVSSLALPHPTPHCRGLGSPGAHLLSTLPLANLEAASPSAGLWTHRV